MNPVMRFPASLATRFPLDMPDLVKDAHIKTLCGRKFNLLGLAEKTRLSQPYLSLIVNGIRAPSKQALEKIAAALEVDIETLKIELEKQRGA